MFLSVGLKCPWKHGVFLYRIYSKDVWDYRSNNECGLDELLTFCLYINPVECSEFGEIKQQAVTYGSTSLLCLLEVNRQLVVQLAAVN